MREIRSRTSDLEKDVLRPMDRKQLLEYAKQNGWTRTGRLWRNFNNKLEEFGIEPLKLVTRDTLRSEGKAIPALPDVEVDNPHFKKAAKMKLYLLN